MIYIFKKTCDELFLKGKPSFLLLMTILNEFKSWGRDVKVGAICNVSWIPLMSTFNWWSCYFFAFFLVVSCPLGGSECTTYHLSRRVLTIYLKYFKLQLYLYHLIVQCNVIIEGMGRIMRCELYCTLFFLRKLYCTCTDQLSHAYHYYQTC